MATYNHLLPLSISNSTVTSMVTPFAISTATFVRPWNTAAFRKDWTTPSALACSTRLLHPYSSRVYKKGINVRVPMLYKLLPIYPARDKGDILTRKHRLSLYEVSVDEGKEALSLSCRENTTGGENGGTLGVFEPREAFDSYEKRAMEASAARTDRTDELADGSDHETDGDGEFVRHC
ncbi:uncharacterized protein BDV14DRAFT_206557 [Aspergillus stella-maris]|uniref:uncharacterized protein n=1 Tax=Aspergillus stella-maris TaxID=1810926 RepID=UPI003CCE4F98